MARYILHTEFEVKFEVENIKYRNKSYTICLAKILKHDSKNILPKKMTLKGDFASIFKGSIYKAKVFIEEDVNWGFYLVLKNIPTEIVPNSKKGVSDFLKRNVGKDITHVQAETLVDMIGVDIIDKIKNDDTILNNVKNLTPTKKKKIVESVRQHAYFKDLMLKVQGNGLEADVANYIYDKYKENSINILNNNPYQLINVAGLTFQTVDRIAYVNKINYKDKNRIKAIIYSLIDSSINNKGYSCIKRNVLLKNFNKFVKRKAYFNKNIPININVVNKIIDEMILDKKISEEIYNNESYIYKNNLLITEKNIAAYLKDFSNKDFISLLDEQTIEKFINDYEQNYFKLSQGQKDAIKMVLTNKISVLTGGPGTGKTQTVNTLLKCISQYRPDLKISLMAPTGKASNRMKELTNQEATTIHRGIHLNLFDKENETQMVEADLVIIDESSMIDMFLFEKLMENIPSTANILFVGDVDQLPSVGAGNILKDIIDSNKIATTKLTEIFRQSAQSNIVVNSHLIMNNKNIDQLKLDDKNSDFYLEKKTKINDILNEVEITYKKLLDNGCSIEDISILSPMEDGELGNYNLNHIIQEKFNPATGNGNEYQINEIDVFRIGDRVMQTVNNYDLGVMNGESGIISDIKEHNNSGRKEIHVTFPNYDNDVVYFGGQIKELKLSYSCSIHKMQGSETPYIIHIIHDSQNIMLNRNLIYTAWTRAKKQVIIIGQKKALSNAIKNNTANVRCTLLKQRILGEV